ncbi:MAG: ABC transporter [Nocardioidaceae bacterium]
MTESGPPTELLAALVRLRAALAEVRFSLQVPGVDDARTTRKQLVSQLEDYLLPRLVQIDAPLLAVVGGSTGAGKSTLVNSLIGARVSESGVLRPTTRSPVLVHNPADAGWFQPDRILPDLVRTTSATNDTSSLHLIATSVVPAGLALLDAPDVDSVESANRQLAGQLLAAADLWLFVTSAARYADQVPWTFLKKAAERSTAVALVLDRTAPEVIPDVRAHLARMATARGLRDSPLFAVPESPVDEQGLLPADDVAQIRNWLGDLANNARARQAVIRQSLDGAIRQTAFRTHGLADAEMEQVAAATRLRHDAEVGYAAAVSAVERGTGDGTLLRGEVLARWQELVDGEEFGAPLQEGEGRLRDRLKSAVRGRPQGPERVATAVEHGLLRLLTDHAESAAGRTHTSWTSTEAGRALLDGHSIELRHASHDFRDEAQRAIREWRAGVLLLVRDQGIDKKTTARFLAYGVNGLGAALMTVVLVHTSGLAGGEAGVAGGTVLISQKTLEAVFGDRAAHDLADRAKHDLNARTVRLLNTERARFLQLLAPAAPGDGTADRLRDAAREIDDIRHRSEAS